MLGSPLVAQVDNFGQEVHGVTSEGIDLARDSIDDLRGSPHGQHRVAVIPIQDGAPTPVDALGNLANIEPARASIVAPQCALLVARTSCGLWSGKRRRG